MGSRNMRLPAMFYSGINIFLLLVLFTHSLPPSRAARILFLFPFSAPSHNIVFSSLSKELAARGHEITFVTPFPISNPPNNYKQISNYEVLASFFNAPKIQNEQDVFTKIIHVTDTSIKMCINSYQAPGIRELIQSSKNGNKFDLVVSSLFLSDCYHPIAHLFNASLVLISPTGPFPTTDSMMGNSALPSFSPNIFSPFSDRMNFCERLANSMMFIFAHAYYKFVFVPAHEAVAMENLGVSIPSISEVQKKVSLVFLNSHFSMLFPRPLLPNMVEVGGMHLKPPKALPEDIQKFMDDAKEGVIYFSMGSNLKSSDLPNATRNALLQAFGQLKQKLLWKWETDSLPGQTSNVKLSKWWPQSDILAHPNTKLFITHGGLLSFQEAVVRGVPILGIPIYGDQNLNMNRAIGLGVGLKMTLSNITKESMLETINTILNDPSYAENMKKLSVIMKDQPQPPLERAVYWVEYVLRHNGAHHLRSAAIDLTWYQFYMLDIAMTLLIAFVILITIVVFAVKSLLKLLRLSRTPKLKKQ